jgi:hypothetical protein
MPNNMLFDNPGVAAASLMAGLYILSLFLTSLTSTPPRAYAPNKKK